MSLGKEEKRSIVYFAIPYPPRMATAHIARGSPETTCAGSFWRSGCVETTPHSDNVKKRPPGHLFVFFRLRTKRFSAIGGVRASGIKAFHTHRSFP